MRVIRLVAVALAITGLLALSLAAAVAAANQNVSIKESNEKYAYTPADKTVALGDTVTWTNDSDAPHTVDADDGSFELDQFNEGASVKHTFNTAGTIAYHCDIHSYMHGKIIVLAAGVAPPATDTAPETPGGNSGTTSLLLVALGVLFLGVAAFVARRTSRA
jgi:plastocyanin